VIPRLWYVTDGSRGTAGRDLAEVILQAADAGVEAILLRELQRSGSALDELIQRLEPARRRGLRLIASRRLDLVAAYALDGAQLTADSISLDDARRWLGQKVRLGFSAHSVDEALAAQRSGADYVMLAPVFDTASKPDVAGRGLEWLAEASAALSIPVIALGGVTPDRTRGILDVGAWGVAAVSAIGAAPDVARATRAFSRTLAESS